MSPSKDGAARIKSQLSVLARSEISNPPAHGARLVRTFFPIAPRCAGWIAARVADRWAWCGQGFAHSEQR